MTERLERGRIRCFRWLAALLVGIGVCSVTAQARSHELDSASLSLTELDNGRFRVDWQTSSAALREDLAAPAVFPEPCRLEGALLDCGTRGLTGAIEFPWLKGTRTRVIVNLAWSDGTRLVRIVTADTPTLNVYGIPASSGVRKLAPIIGDYTLLGIEHIVTGLDHVFFVLALMLLARSVVTLVATITAFTLAHSLSLIGTVLGVVALPAPPVEAAIALSIVLVCTECLRSNESLARRVPGVVAFAFGLLHGFGFASALLEIGLPENHLPLALFSFNLGVELGQLGALAVAGGLRLLAARLGLAETRWRQGMLYVMGAAAAFWFFDRLGSVLQVD